MQGKTGIIPGSAIDSCFGSYYIGSFNFVFYQVKDDQYHYQYSQANGKNLRVGAKNSLRLVKITHLVRLQRKHTKR
jgi:hypothetical protein